MRLLVLLATLLLAACATPKTAPEAYYSDVYAPGTVTINDQGGYVTTAAVFDARDEATARKAALARLLLKAKDGGYAYFDILSEDREAVFGVKVSFTGMLYKRTASDADVYPIDDIKRMLKGLEVRTLREIAEERRRREAARKKAASASSSSRNVPAKSSVAPAAAPAAESAPSGEPMVIMAPEDITGSVRKAGGPQRVPASGRGATLIRPGRGQERPASLRLIPQGVVLQSQ